VWYRKITAEGIQDMEWRKGDTKGFSVGGRISDGENRDNGNGKRTKKTVDGQRKWDPEKSTKGNTTEKIRRGGHKQKR
jgi:hypothetical protein